MVLGPENANTGATQPCSPDVEIIVYRHEEWMKVFIHECVHAFGIDFSTLDASRIDETTGKEGDAWNARVRGMFPVIDSKINLCEAYTETIAILLHSCFVSLVGQDGGGGGGGGSVTTINFGKCLRNFRTIIQFEQTFKMLQMVKALSHMGLRYSDFWESPDRCRRNFHEKTNILAYYIIANVMIHHYNSFLNWCMRNNASGSVVKIHANEAQVNRLCNWIDSVRRSSSFCKSVQETEMFTTSVSFSSDDTSPLVSTFRMSVIQLC